MVNCAFAPRNPDTPKKYNKIPLPRGKPNVQIPLFFPHPFRPIRVSEPHSTALGGGEGGDKISPRKAKHIYAQDKQDTHTHSAWPPPPLNAIPRAVSRTTLHPCHRRRRYFSAACPHRRCGCPYIPDSMSPFQPTTVRTC